MSISDYATIGSFAVAVFQLVVGIADRQRTSSLPIGKIGRPGWITTLIIICIVLATITGILTSPVGHRFSGVVATSGASGQGVAVGGGVANGGGTATGGVSVQGNGSVGNSGNGATITVGPSGQQQTQKKKVTPNAR